MILIALVVELTHSSVPNAYIQSCARDIRLRVVDMLCRVTLDGGVGRRHRHGEMMGVDLEA